MNTVNDDQIDLLELFRAIWKNILAIALVAVLVGAAAFGYTVCCITPTYQATASLYVNNSSFSFGAANFSISTAELNAASALVPTYIYILESRTTMEEVIQEADLSYTSDQLSGMISASAVSSTGAFEVTATSTSPAEAELIANTVAKILPDRIAEIVDGSAVRIVDYAIIPAHRSSPSIIKNTAMGILLGGFLSVAWVVLRSLMDDRSRILIQSADELREMYPDVRVLAVIPDMRMAEKKYGYYNSYYAQTETTKKDGNKHGRNKGA